MHYKISVILLLVVAFEAIAYPAFDDGTVSEGLDTDEYDNGEDIWSPVQYKRFWSPHPSDLNPLRRIFHRRYADESPVPVPRGSKRDSPVVYHPIPRIITMKQRSLGQEEYLEDPSEGFLEGGRQKKQTRPTTLIFRLGSWGLRSSKGHKPGLVATPSPNAA